MGDVTRTSSGVYGSGFNVQTGEQYMAKIGMVHWLVRQGVTIQGSGEQSPS